MRLNRVSDLLFLRADSPGLYYLKRVLCRLSLDGSDSYHTITQSIRLRISMVDHLFLVCLLLSAVMWYFLFILLSPFFSRNMDSSRIETARLESIFLLKEGDGKMNRGQHIIAERRRWITERWSTIAILVSVAALIS